MCYLAAESVQNANVDCNLPGKHPKKFSDFFELNVFFTVWRREIQGLERPLHQPLKNVQ